MKRAVAVVMLVVLMAIVSGVDQVSSAVSAQTPGEADRHRREIAARLQTIPPGSPVEIQPVKGRRFQALLESVTADSVTVKEASGTMSISRTLSFDEIRDLKQIKKIGGGLGTGTKVLIGVGVGLAVTVGACAAALNSVESPGVDQAGDADGAHHD